MALELKAKAKLAKMMRTARLTCFAQQVSAAKYVPTTMIATSSASTVKTVSVFPAPALAAATARSKLMKNVTMAEMWAVMAALPLAALNMALIAKQIIRANLYAKRIVAMAN